MTLKRRLHCRFQAAQRGVTILVVLVLLTVMLLGGMALARMTEVGSLAAGNSAFRVAALQASEVGLNEVFAQVRGIANENIAVGTWYRPSTITDNDAAGLPNVDWSTLPEIIVGQYSVRYIADRLCDGVLPVLEPLKQCLVKQIPQPQSSVWGKEQLDAPNSKQFRVTIRVTGPKNTQTWVQSMITKG